MMMLKTKNGPLIPALRFPEFKDSGAWEEKELGQYLNYQQPTKYLVSNTNYKDIYKTPVLTAGKTFILGYTNELNNIFNDSLPVIIFDDFTTASKFVDFPFKAKSSAMKILSSTSGSDIRFMFELLQNINYEVANHERHWISKFAPMKIFLPTLPEQEKIADCLSSIDDLIGAESEKLEAYKEHKKGLMQKLFPVEGKTIPALRFPEFRDSGAWEERKLGEIADIKTGTSNRQDSTTNGGQYVFFDRSQDIRTSNNFLFDSEAIIIGGEGKKFKPKYFCGKFDLHQRAYATMNFQASVGLFLYYCIDFFGDAYFQSQAVGSTVKSLRLPMFQTMPISLPPKDEQQKIADCLSSIDDLITAQTEIIKQLSKHKKGLMQKLFPSLKEENNE